ncbi:tyrosine phosphatase [Trypanosoma grayi]|uniref:tyrosine phosphatase n=1 Tax=Trypanosoma grayi TaxID=71804 RepID=UPI0004F495AD|nr:tyrosine phosphatase [Trypanosoma grayi]KEG12136.1 tyrosine phosphatase [Trypanosoma grayi]
MATQTSSSLMLPARSPPAMHEPLVPSINFAMVCPGVYRSGYPTRKNYRFIRALRLRTILYLCPEEYAESNVKFCEENGINILRFSTEGNKEPFMDISEPLMHRILSALIDTRTHPVLIHCNKGKHRTGTVVACLRLLQGWSLVSIFQEYCGFAGDKARMGDQQYVELYNPIVRLTPPYVAEWVCITPTVTEVRSEEELLEAEARQLGWSLVAPPPPLTKLTAQHHVEGKATEHATNNTAKLATKSSATTTTTTTTTSSAAATATAAAAAMPVTPHVPTATSRRGVGGGHSDSSGAIGASRVKDTAASVRRDTGGDGKKNQK